jgi:hypothetical protein
VAASAGKSSRPRHVAFHDVLSLHRSENRNRHGHGLNAIGRLRCGLSRYSCRIGLSSA